MNPDIEVMKRAIEAQLDDYEREIAAFAAFMEARAPQPRLFSQEAGITLSEATK